MSDARPPRVADGSYSEAWRNFTRIVLPPSIRALMALRLERAGERPAQGRHDPGRQPPVLHGHPGPLAVRRTGAGRYPVFLAKSSLFDVPVLGWLMHQARPAAGLPGPDRRRAGPAGRRADQPGGRLRDLLPRGDGDPGPGPVADGGQDRRGPARPGGRTSRSSRSRTGARSGSCPTASFLPRVLPRKTVRVLAGPPVDLSEFAGQPLSSQVAAGRHRQDHGRRGRAARPAARRGRRPPCPTTRPSPAGSSGPT